MGRSSREYENWLEQEQQYDSVDTYLELLVAVAIKNKENENGQD